LVITDGWGTISIVSVSKTIFGIFVKQIQSPIRTFGSLAGAICIRGASPNSLHIWKLTKYAVDLLQTLLIYLFIEFIWQSRAAYVHINTYGIISECMQITLPPFIDIYFMFAACQTFVYLPPAPVNIVTAGLHA